MKTTRELTILPQLIKNLRTEEPQADTTPFIFKIAKSGNGDLLSQFSYTNHGLLLLTGTTPNKNTALHIAARQGHCINFAARISDLCPSPPGGELKRGQSTAHRGKEWKCPFVVELIKCAQKNELAEEMLRKRNEGLNTALHEAASSHHHFVVELLIREEPELVLLMNAAGASPLYLAAEEGALECVLGIPKNKGSSISQAYYSGPDGRTPLHAAVLRGHLCKKFLLTNELG